jgi:hypothetical protein
MKLREIANSPVPDPPKRDPVFAASVDQFTFAGSREILDRWIADYDFLMDALVEITRITDDDSEAQNLAIRAICGVAPQSGWWHAVCLLPEGYRIQRAIWASAPNRAVEDYDSLVEFLFELPDAT